MFTEREIGVLTILYFIRVFYFPGKNVFQNKQVISLYIFFNYLVLESKRTLHSLSVITLTLLSKDCI